MLLLCSQIYLLDKMAPSLEIARVALIIQSRASSVGDGDWEINCQPCKRHWCQLASSTGMEDAIFHPTHNEPGVHGQGKALISCCSRWREGHLQGGPMGLALLAASSAH